MQLPTVFIVDDDPGVRDSLAILFETARLRTRCFASAEEYLAACSADDDGCLVCPWHGSAYDVTTGRMVRGPQGAYAKVPGLDAAYIGLTKAFPLRRGTVTVDGEELVVDDATG